MRRFDRIGHERVRHFHFRSANGLAQGPTIAIGVAADQPGLGFLHGGEYSGFDISVAQYVANTLGFAKKQIVFKQVLPSTRVSSLEDGTVDMVVDAFAADDVQDGEVELAGPYLTVHAALLVRSDSAGTITGTDDLAGRTVCVAKGGIPSYSVRNLAEDVTVSERDTYPQCETALMIGQADAIAADDAIAAGLASNRGGGYLKVVGETFGERSYAIAVKSGQSTLAKQIDAALQSMMDDGSWKQAIDKMKQSIGYVPDMSLNPPAITLSAASEG